MVKLIYGYTLEENLSESASLINHFSFKSIIIKKRKLEQLLKENNKLLILLISNLSLYTDYIKKSKRKLIIFHLSDEGYDFSQAKIYKNKNIKFIIRNYKIFPFFFLSRALLKWPLITFKYVCVYWIYNVWHHNVTFYTNFKHLKYILFSIKYLLRQIIFSWLIKKIEKKIIYAPLNETNFFYKGKSKKTNKKYPLSFAGSVHSSERIRVQLIAKEMGYSHGYSGWSTSSKKSLTSNAYTQILKNSKYSLCPTGYINLDTFRFYEIIKSGSLPILPKETPYQPFNYYSKIYNVDQRVFINSYTKINIKKKIENISNKDYKLILKNLQKSILLKNKKIKFFLSKYSSYK
jgi:hypothetical protein